jgi:hypothetical protein
MGEMLKCDALGYYYVKYDDETGEILHDPRAIFEEPVEEEEDVSDVIVDSKPIALPAGAIKKAK